jgi:serine/threonine-protein kinase
MVSPEEAQALRKYRLIAEIGRGGMADVFLAVVQGPAGFNKLVVIKKTRPELAQDPEFLAMFLDEARLAARLNHPNVVQTTEVGQDGERYFIAMEYLDGQPLNRIRARAGLTFSTNMQVRVIADTLAGLHHAHELCDFDGTPLGVVHRDATPQNVFVTYDGLIKVVDFGIAKAIDSSTETRTGTVKGKVTYMAPEQAKGERVDRRADVFAVGVMLWEGIVGRRMWKGIPELAVVHDLINGRVPPLREAMPDVPEELARICERATAARPEDRYATAQEMHDALEEYLGAAGGHTSARDVGKFVAERFAEDRAKVKALIESQLHDLRWSGAYPKTTGLDLPKIDPGQVVITPTGQQSLGRTPADQRFDSASGRVALPTSPSGELARSSSSLTNAATAIPASGAAKAQKPLALIAVAVVAALGVLVLGVRFLGSSPPPAPAKTTDAVTAPPPTATPPPLPAQDAVKLTVRVSPPGARIFLDDALLSAGSFEGKVVKSDRPRRIRVEAEQHVAKEETVALTGDVMLSVSLEKEAGGATPSHQGGGRGRPVAAPAAPAPEPQAAPAPPPAAPTPQPAATPAPAPAQTGKPKRAIDSDSPYAQ